MTLILRRCDLCRDEETAWEQDDPTGQKLANHQARQHNTPASPDPAQSEAIADLLWVDPKHSTGRTTILAAICADADAHGGHVDQNRVREQLPAWVAPQLIGSVYNVLLRRGALLPDTPTVNKDRKGRNGGKPLRTYVLVRDRVAS